MRLEKLLIVPDVHAPYHDKKAWSLLIKAAKQFKPDIIITLGDFFDFFIVSSHDKAPRGIVQLEEEIKEGRVLLAQLEALAPKRKIFLEGNHEDRLSRFLMVKAPQLYSMLTPDKVLGLRERGWEYVPYKDHIKVGKVYFTHDCGHSGKTALEKSQATYENNLVIGHTHRMEMRILGNARGKPHVAYSFGWLGSAEAADYMHKIKALREWATGFGIGYINPKTREVHLQAVPIFEDHLVLEGKTIKLDR